MKVSELWLHEWITPSLTREELCSKLTLCGLEVEGVSPVADQFTQVVVGEIQNAEKHPHTDRLQICTVDVNNSKPLMIVCGAKNARPGIKVPVALEGAMLPHHKKITLSEIQGVPSQGMLCSASELGLTEDKEDLLQLSADAPIGENLWDYLKLTDFVIEIGITPNRGDCLSMLGLTKEISAITETPYHSPHIQTIHPVITDTLPVKCHAPMICPSYVGRIIRQVKADITTPMWIQERLRRGGMRSINAIVDIMNYVMLELGQPMHAFDLHEIEDEIQIRMANSNEDLVLLDGQSVQLTNTTLVISDQKKPLAIAGVMGGLDSSVTLLTNDIFLESAYFNPNHIAQTGRHFSLNSESSYRFERGIDPTIQHKAIERATDLLMEVVGGKPGPIIEVIETDYLPKTANIVLRKERLKKILGMQISENSVNNILRRLQFTFKLLENGWEVSVPSRRSDIAIEADLIEEIARLHGYEKVPQHRPNVSMQVYPQPETKLSLSQIRKTIMDLGYNEVITYSFVDKKLQNLFEPDSLAKELVNPISMDMNVMRVSLWPGLVMALKYNLNRQQTRAKFFETGLRFVFSPSGELIQQRVLSGLMSGSRYLEQWGLPHIEFDFFDLKGDLQNVVNLTLEPNEFRFEVGQHTALHPGQTAKITKKGQIVGLMGSLHPKIMQTLDIKGNVFLFEIVVDGFENKKLPFVQEISKFPEIRRDISILVDRTVPVQLIQDTIKEVCGGLLKDVVLFDVYQGKGIATDKKSIALGLILQHLNRTLKDEEVADLFERVIEALKDQFAAELRG